MESRVRIQALGDELRSLSIIMKKGLKDCEVGERPFWRMTKILLVKKQNQPTNQTKNPLRNKRNISAREADLIASTAGACGPFRKNVNSCH